MGFFGISSTLIDAHTLPGKLALACRRVGLRNGWMGGFNRVFDSIEPEAHRARRKRE